MDNLIFKRKDMNLMILKYVKFFLFLVGFFVSCSSLSMVDPNEAQGAARRTQWLNHSEKEIDFMLSDESTTQVELDDENLPEHFSRLIDRGYELNKLYDLEKRRPLIQLPIYATRWTENPYVKIHNELKQYSYYNESEYYIFIDTEINKYKGDFVYINDDFQSTTERLLKLYNWKNIAGGKAYHKKVNFKQKNPNAVMLYFRDLSFGKNKDIFNEVILSNNNSYEETIKTIYREANKVLYNNFKKSKMPYSFNNFSIRYEGYALEEFYNEVFQKNQNLKDFLVKFPAMIYITEQENAGRYRKIKIEESEPIIANAQKKLFAKLIIGGIIFGAPLIIFLYEKYYKKEQREKI